MKRLIVSFCLLLLALSPFVSAEIGSKGLIIENGKEQIILQKGDKIKLSVRDGLSKRFVFKNLVFYSDNKIVATVEKKSGLLHANSMGTATISVLNEHGDAGKIKVKVTTVKEKPSLITLSILALLPFTILFIIKYKKSAR